MNSRSDWILYQAVEHEHHRKVILRQALELSSHVGLLCMSFDRLAKEAGTPIVQLSDHFGTEEALQCQVVDAAATRFVDVVLSPTLRVGRGLPRLQALFESWLRWEATEVDRLPWFSATASELDNCTPLVRDRVLGYLNEGLGLITRATEIAIEQGHLRHDLDTQQFAYEFKMLQLAFQKRRYGLGDSATTWDLTIAEVRSRRAFARLIQDAKGPTVH